MFKYYDILINGKHICTVLALTEQSAIDKAYNQYGSASRYSGIGRNQIQAVPV